MKFLLPVQFLSHVLIGEHGLDFDYRSTLLKNFKANGDIIIHFYWNSPPRTGIGSVCGGGETAAPDTTYGLCSQESFIPCQILLSFLFTANDFFFFAFVSLHVAILLFLLHFFQFHTLPNCFVLHFPPKILLSMPAPGPSC